jgi:D-serine deaminase-like pyridoxal phosphate-dependent protein
VTEPVWETAETPAVLLDAERLRRNIAAMEERASLLGVALRPHLKTAKSADVAAQIPSAKQHGITVSTAREAEHFAAHGFHDQLYAVASAPSRLHRFVSLVAAGTRVRLAVDSVAAAQAIQDAAGKGGVTFEVWIEIDCGEHRSGVAPDDPELERIANVIAASPATRLTGVFTHGGQSYGCRDIDSIRRVAEDERSAVVHAAERLEALGWPCPNRSVGSTPTAVHALHLDGVTELRAGVYVFQDLFQAGVGSCRVDDIAASVLTTVIGHQERHGRLLIDAGGLALSKDRSTGALGGAEDCGYGLLQAAEGGPPLDGLSVSDVYQEHGVVTGRDGIDFDRFPVGTRLRVLPNHACMTCAAFDRYHVIDVDHPAAVWPRVNGWA